jgi:hypothetical protein
MRRASAAVQHVLRDEPHPRLLRQILQDAGGGDGAQRGLLRGGQPAHGADRCADGRIHALCLHRRDGGHSLRVDDARPDQGPLAAGADRGPEGRDLPPDRWLHKPRRCDHGDGQGRAAAGCGDRAEMAGRWLCLDRRSLGRHLHEDGGEGRQPRPLRRAGRDPCRACGDRHRQPRAAHGAAVGDQDARHPGGASVYRDGARPGAGRNGARTNPEHPVLRDADAKWYVREERGGWILGPYERARPRGSNTRCPTVSAPTSSRSIWSGSRRNT